MAIRVVDGVPGSGKSFYAVKHLVDTYYTKDHAGYYVPKPFTHIDEKTGVNTEQTLIIVTNLEGLKLPHVSLDDEMREAGGVLTFWSHAYQEKIEKIEERRIYIVDEAQRYFRTKVTGDWSDVWYYFEKHRHFGHDIYLLTQNPKKIHSEITALLEYRIHAKPRVRSVTGEFPYQMICDGDIMKRFGYRPDNKIFDLYKSRRKGETEKIHNPVMRFVALAAVACLFVGFGGYYILKSKLMPGSVTSAEATIIPVVPQSVSASAVSASTVSASAVSVPPVSAFTVPSGSVLIPLNTIVRYMNGRAVVTYFTKDEYFPEIGFPYPLKKIGGKMYAVMAVPEKIQETPSVSII